MAKLINKKIYLFVLPTIGILYGYLLIFDFLPRLSLLLAFFAWNLILFSFIHDLRSEHKQQMEELLALQQASMAALVDLAQMRDHEVTGSHLYRLSYYAEILTENLDLPKEQKMNIIQTISLHDIGKVAVPDQVLNKRGPLDPEEWKVIQRHPQQGAAVLESITKGLKVAHPSVLEYIATAQDIALSHHERWDGSGYPQGLKGDEIPLSARVAAICDVYDSLRSPRPYKKPFSHQEAVAIIKNGKGTHFDPLLVDSFMHFAHRFATVWDQHGQTLNQIDLV